MCWINLVITDHGSQWDVLEPSGKCKLCLTAWWESVFCAFWRNLPCGTGLFWSRTHCYFQQTIIPKFKWSTTFQPLSDNLQSLLCLSGLSKLCSCLHVVGIEVVIVCCLLACCVRMWAPSAADCPMAVCGTVWNKSGIESNAPPLLWGFPFPWAWILSSKTYAMGYEQGSEKAALLQRAETMHFYFLKGKTSGSKNVLGAAICLKWNIKCIDFQTSSLLQNKALILFTYFVSFIYEVVAILLKWIRWLWTLVIVRMLSRKKNIPLLQCSCWFYEHWDDNSYSIFNFMVLQNKIGTCSFFRVSGSMVLYLGPRVNREAYTLWAGASLLCVQPSLPICHYHPGFQVTLGTPEVLGIWVFSQHSRWVSCPTSLFFMSHKK